MSLISKLLMSLAIVTAISCQFFSSTEDSRISEVKGLKLGFPDAPQTWDWVLAADRTSQFLAQNTMEGLTKLEGTKHGLIPQEALAEKWEKNPESTRFVFTLRPIKWTDGTALKAEDILNTFEKLLSAKSKSQCASMFFSIRDAKKYFEGGAEFKNIGIKALDEKTIEFDLTESQSFFPVFLAQPCAFPSKRGVEKSPTLGAYKVLDLSDEKVVLDVNKNYYGQKPMVSQVSIFFNLSTSDSEKMFHDQKLDIVFDQGGILAPTFEVTYLIFNIKKKPFHNPVVRHAFGALFDHEELSKVIRPPAFPFSGMIPRGLVGYESNRGMRFDPTYSKQLLEKSGYRDLDKYSPYILWHEDNRDMALLAKNIQDQMKRILDINVDARPTLIPNTLTAKDEVSFILMNWKATYADAQGFISQFTTTSKFNPAGWKDRNYNLYVSKSALASSPEDRRKAFAKAQHVITEEEIPILPLIVHAQNYSVQKRVKNFYPDVTRNFSLRDIVIE